MSDLSPNAQAAIRRAEAAVEALSPAFQSWLAEEVQALVEACGAAELERFSIESRQGIFLSAHTLKGQAATLGYPQIAQLAASLCRLLEYWTPVDSFRHLTSQHVQAIDGVVKQDDAERRQGEASALIRRLSAKTSMLLGDTSDED